MKRPPGLARAVRTYARLLRLYPKDFRDQFGEEAVEMFEDVYAAEHARGGRWAIVRLWVRTLVNVLWHGPAERLRIGERSVRPSTGDAGAMAGSGVLADARFALRALRRSPRFSMGAVATLGVGVGSSLLLFSLVNAILLRSLPFPEAERLVSLWETHPESGRLKEGPSPRNFMDWEREAEAFTAMAAGYLSSTTVRNVDVVEETRSAQVTPEYFRVLGVEPALGRNFNPDEGAARGPVMLSHAFWTRAFGADPAVVGSSIEVDGVSYEVAGVMPPRFTYPSPSVEFWMAWDFDAVYGDRPETRTWRFLDVVARMAPGVTIPTAEHDLTGVQQGLVEAYPDANRGWSAAVSPLRSEVVGGIASTLWTGFAGVAVLLLLACANVANLLLARAPKRAQELAVRQALGASRWRLVRQLVIENLTLALAATVVGLAVSYGLLELLTRLEAGRIPRIDEVGFDLVVVAFAGCLVVVTSLVFGLAPVVELLRPGRRAVATRSVSGGVRHGLVTLQVALAFVVLVGAGLFLSTLQRVQTVDLGIDPESTLAFRVSLDPQNGADGGTWQYYSQLLDGLEQLPEVQAVGASQTLPLDPVASDFTRPYRPAGSGIEAADASSVALRIVTPGYFAATGMTVQQGGTTTGAEEAGGPLVSVINRTLADRLWPGQDPVGQTLDIDFRGGWAPYTVLGVVSDVRHAGPRAPAREEVYLSARQHPYLAMSVVMRVTGDPESLVPRVRSAVLAQPPGQPPYRFVGFDDLLRDATGAERLLATLLAAFAFFAVVLSWSGIHGLVAFTVASRTKEYGIRLALGDRVGRLTRGLSVQTLKMAGAGLVAGGVVLLLISPSLRPQLFGIGPFDPLVVTTVTAIVVAIAVGAALVSARALGRIEPAHALRSE